MSDSSEIFYNSAMKRGKYKLKKRAERQEETRLQIVRATLRLHEMVGSTAATISAIAEKAGVSRPTIYNHFPDGLESLGRACSELELSENPLPDPEPWAKIADPQERLRSALAELYAYFRRREGLWANIVRDAELVDMGEELKPNIAHWERMQETLAAGWESPNGTPEPLLVGAIGLALDFKTWRTLVRQQGLSDEQAVEVMARMVHCVTRG
jgi:AcrR family transcriptional regulator